MSSATGRIKEEFDFAPYRGLSDAQLLETGKNWVDENNYYSLQRCIDFIGAIRHQKKLNVAVELSQYLFSKVPSVRNLNTLMTCVNSEGNINKQVEMLNKMDELLGQCGTSYDSSIFAIWLKTANNLIDIGKVQRERFYEILEKCPDEEKCSNSYIIAQYFVRLNADGKYDEVIKHYKQVRPGAQRNIYVRRYYENAVKHSGLIPGALDDPIKSGERSVNGKGIFVVFGRNSELHTYITKLLKLTNATVISLEDTGPEGSMTIIEQLDSHIRDAMYAIVLLTPDDVGYLASDGSEKMEHRARQNVLIEYGYTLGVLGRQNVLSIVQDSGLDLPSDLGGIRYVPYDSADKKRTIPDLVKQLEKWNFEVNKDMIDFIMSVD